MSDENSFLPESDIEKELEYEQLVDERGINDYEDDEDEDEEEDEELDEEEVYRKALETVEAHQKKMDVLYSGTGMYWLGMSMGWKVFRVLHTRRSYLTIKVLGVTRHSLTFHHASSLSHV